MHYHMKLWTIIGCTLLISAAACKKAANTAAGGGGGPTKTTGVDSTYNPVDPPLAATIGLCEQGIGRYVHVGQLHVRRQRAVDEAIGTQGHPGRIAIEQPDRR